MQFDEGELRGSVDGDEHVQLTLFGAHFGNVDVEVADRIALELRFAGLSPSTSGSRPIPWRCRQRCRDDLVRCGMVGLEGVEAVVERQQGIAPEGDDDGLVLGGEDCRLRFLRAGLKIGDRGPLFPFGDGLRVDAVALGEGPQALLTMLYSSTDRLRRRGASMKNLADVVVKVAHPSVRRLDAFFSATSGR